ncbi:MAG: hypothetical protein ACHQLQ_10640 [Candidatus Acidiferrales bacterium]
MMERLLQTNPLAANQDAVIPSFQGKDAADGLHTVFAGRWGNLPQILLSVLSSVWFLTGCGAQEPASTTTQAEAKPAERAVPEDVQGAAEALLGSETQVLVFGDLAKTGKQQFLAANVVPKTPTNSAPGTIVTRAVIAENNDGKWMELLRCDEYLKNEKGFLGLTPLNGVNGWRIQYEQDTEKGLQVYFTPLKVDGSTHVLPIGVRWNPATKRYQSLDRTYEHFLLEAPSLERARSMLR